VLGAPRSQVQATAGANLQRDLLQIDKPHAPSGAASWRSSDSFVQVEQCHEPATRSADRLDMSLPASLETGAMLRVGLCILRVERRKFCNRPRWWVTCLDRRAYAGRLLDLIYDAVTPKSCQRITPLTMLRALSIRHQYWERGESVRSVTRDTWFLVIIRAAVRNA
jgi:hypothetical protein